MATESIVHPVHPGSPSPEESALTHPLEYVNSTPPAYAEHVHCKVLVYNDHGNG